MSDENIVGFANTTKLDWGSWKGSQDLYKDQRFNDLLKDVNEKTREMVMVQQEAMMKLALESGLTPLDIVACHAYVTDEKTGKTVFKCWLEKKVK